MAKTAHMPPPEHAWRTLRQDRALRHLEAACLPLRQRMDGCDACRAACPAGALLFEDAGLALHADCHGCGRCLPACPMGALDLPEARPAVAAASGEPSRSALAIDCRRVPARLRGEITVPCLGALDAAALLELRAQAGARGIELRDRGWCADCPAGGDGAHPAQAAVNACIMHLVELGQPPARWPRLVDAALPAKHALPLGTGSAALSRRAFFARFAEPVRVRGAPAARRSMPASPAHASLARNRLLAALSALAPAGRTTAHAHPLLRATTRCRDHQGCVRVCPTGALRAWREHETGGLRFAAAQCIACGLCAQHCPEQALQLSAPSATASPNDGEATLTRHTRARCTGCGAELRIDAEAGVDAPALCDPCAKSRHLAGALFQQFFGARA